MPPAAPKKGPGPANPGLQANEPKPPGFLVFLESGGKLLDDVAYAAAHPNARARCSSAPGQGLLQRMHVHRRMKTPHQCKA